MNDEWMNMSIFHHSSWDHQGFDRTAWDHCWVRTRYTFSWDVSALLKGDSFDWPHIFLDEGSFFYAHLQAASSLLVWKTRLLFLYSLAALWSHKANCTAPGSLTWDVYSTQTCPQELPPAPCLYNSKITPWDWWRNCYIFGNRWVQSGCFSNIPEILHELFGGKLVL